jgi:hypothetical protein
LLGWGGGGGARGRMPSDFWRLTYEANRGQWKKFHCCLWLRLSRYGIPTERGTNSAVSGYSTVITSYERFTNVQYDVTRKTEYQRLWSGSLHSLNDAAINTTVQSRQRIARSTLLRTLITLHIWIFRYRKNGGGYQGSHLRETGTVSFLTATS